jgi:uncharacterized SAM-binding protein YcdF (DUF218 family)
MSPYGPARRSTVRKVLWTALSVYLLLTATPLAWYFGSPLFESSDARKSDVIVLMSSGQIDPNWLTPDAAQRTLGALQLFRKNYAPAIISSGSQHGGGLTQAELQAAWLERAGVPATAVVVENRSGRTYESAVEVKRIMAQYGWKSAVVVTSQMDVPRVRGVFRKLGVEASYLPVPEFRRPYGFDYFRSGQAMVYHATYEYAGLVYYKLRGWI